MAQKKTTENFLKGRANNKVRPIILKYDTFGFASSSVLLSIGRTKVLVSVTLQNSVPRFLKGQKKGWLAAEYAMLPCATKKRTTREGSQGYKSSRSVEISRLIGRCFRSVVDLEVFSDKTIMIDCDVLQADGGTRVACITAASVALKLAEKRWLENQIIEQSFLKEEIAAISVGLVDNKAYLDLDFYLDSNAQADFNFVFTKSEKLIEVQGTAEKEPISFEQFENLKKLALNGVKQIFSVIDSNGNKKNTAKIGINRSKTSMFSLGNRINNI
ncbi:ribonuclease PH [Candidatus Dependentiae bacterium]|nr:ribonuclease PH [Candidatus Dependentiae bacterium]